MDLVRARELADSAPSAGCVPRLKAWARMGPSGAAGREPVEDAPRASAGPHPLDLPTAAQGMALAAVDSGRRTVEPGSDALTTDSEQPGASRRLGSLTSCALETGSRQTAGVPHWPVATPSAGGWADQPDPADRSSIDHPRPSRLPGGKATGRSFRRPRDAWPPMPIIRLDRAATSASATRPSGEFRGARRDSPDLFLACARQLPAA